MSDVVGAWEVALSDKVHRVEFEHGTTSGKRVVRVDGKEALRKDWMFKLVGQEHFRIGKANCCITIEAISGFTYRYTLEVNGKSHKKFCENQTKIMKTWVVTSGVTTPTRVVLEKDTLDVWINGSRVETTGEFIEDGTSTHFTIGRNSACIKAYNSGKRKTGIIHQLFVNDVEIPETNE